MYSNHNIESLFKLIGSFSSQEYSEEGNYSIIKTSDSIWPNEIFNFNAKLEELEAVLDRLENRIQKGEIPDLLMCNPLIGSSEIIDRIKSRNYKSGVWTAMSHSLTSSELQPIDPTFTIKLVENENALRDWLLIAESELMGNQSLNKAIFLELFHGNQCYFYMGFVNNKPVATALLFRTDLDAGIYLVATLNAYRKRGIGKQMTNICLYQAHKLNCNKVDLQATDHGKNVYASLGFKEYGKMNVFRIQKSK